MNPCGVFFALFLRSFILLRELENVEPPRLRSIKGYHRSSEFFFFAACNTHASMV